MALATPVDNQSNNVLKCPSPASMDLTTRNCKTNVRKFYSEEEVAEALAKYVVKLSGKYIMEKGSFSVVLSGGTLFHTLRYAKFRDIFGLQTECITIHVILLVPISPCHIYALNDKLSPKAAADDYEARLKHLVYSKTIPASGFPKFDLMLLGIGPDGHVASLFPTRPQRFEEKRWVTFITDSPKPPPQRITFTFPAINSASEIVMVVTGAELADAVKITLGGVLPPGVTPLPCVN